MPTHRALVTAAFAAVLATGCTSDLGPRPDALFPIEQDGK